MEDIQSRALQFAIAAGLKPQMAYTVRQTALYSGVPRSTPYAAPKAGRLQFQTYGKRNALISVEELDRWMNEN